MGRKSWNGVAILARGKQPHETQRGLPGDPDDAHSRYIEAAVGGILIGCLYLPNGNPAPGPKLLGAALGGGQFAGAGLAAALADEDASMLLIPIASLAGMTLPEPERGGQAMSEDALEGLMQDAEQVLPVCVLGLRRFWRGASGGFRYRSALREGGH